MVLYLENSEQIVQNHIRDANARVLLSPPLTLMTHTEFVALIVEAPRGWVFSSWHNFFLLFADTQRRIPKVARAEPKIMANR